MINKTLLESLSSRYKTNETDGVLSVKPINHIDKGTVIDNRGNDDIQYKDAVARSVHVNDENNIALQNAISYTKRRMQSHYQKAIEAPVSSLSKQAAIGKAYDLAAKESPEYKKVVFELYKKHHPDMIKEHNITDYDDLVKKSYIQLAKETLAQFHTLPVSMQYHDGKLSYSDSSEMLKDIRHHNNMTVYRGGDRHEFLHHIDNETGLSENEMFRAVHDYYGHAIHGNPFGAKGEEIAWESHSKMYSPLAMVAMTAETRGQNSFVNYTGLNSDTYVKMEHHRKEARKAFDKGDMKSYTLHKKALSTLGGNWNYAPQKSVALPPSMNRVDYDGKMPKEIQNLIHKQESSYDVEKDPLKLVQLARSHNTSSYLSSVGGVYDRKNAIKDFNMLLSHHGYTSVTKPPIL